MPETTNPLPEEPQAPRMQLVDLFLLIACAAAGMGLGSAMLRSDMRASAGIHPGDIIVGMVLPSLFGALAIGHPLLMLLHVVTGRRHSAITYGERVGLVPVVTLAFMLSMLILCWGIESATERTFVSVYLAVGAVLIFVFANLACSISAAIYLVYKAVGMEWGPWTDLLGAFAALLPGATVVLLFLIALLVT